MFQYKDLIQSHETVRDVVHRYPQTREVFESTGIRACCFDCTIRTAAVRGGIDLFSLLNELDRAAYGEAATTAQ